MTFNSTHVYLNRPKFVLTHLGVWLPPSRYEFLHMAYKILIMLTQYSFIVLEFIYIAGVWGDLEAVSEASYLLFTQASVCYKATVFITSKSNLRSLLKFMSCNTFAPKTKEQEKCLLMTCTLLVRVTQSKWYVGLAMTFNSERTYLNLPKFVLTLLGLWFTPGRYTYLHVAYKILIMLTQYTFVLFEVMYIAGVWGDLEVMSDASYMLFTLALVCYKGTDFIVNKRSLRYLLNFMTCDAFAPKTMKEEKILLTHARKVKNLSMFFLINALTTCTLWAIIPLLEEERVFPFNIWMPVGPERSPQYELGYTYQMMSIYISALLFFAVDGTTLAMMMYGCAQIEIIIDNIRKVEPVPIANTHKDIYKVEIKIQRNNRLVVQCIQHHQMVISFIEALENSYHANIFFQLCGTVAIICIIGLRISIEEPSSMQFYSMLNYMITMLAQLFLYCWCGSELTSMSEVLRESLYQCSWYAQDSKFKRWLFIAMERMKRPIIFKAGHYIPLSRPTFVSILRSSYSYFAVLNQAKNK